MKQPPIYMVVTRRARPGCEAELEESLRDFFKMSFAHPGVLGASMILPPPGSDSREFGILRTFRGVKERDAFYQSPMLKAWEESAHHLIEGEPVFRELNGLEAWFRTSSSPARWKMAVATLIGVYPTGILLSLTVGRAAHPLPPAVRSLVLSACMVVLLTWVVMPVVTRVLSGWLNASGKTKITR